MNYSVPLGKEERAFTKHYIQYDELMSFMKYLRKEKDYELSIIFEILYKFGIRISAIAKLKVKDLSNNMTLASKTKYGLDISIPRFSFDYDLSLKDELPCIIHKDEDSLIKDLSDFESEKDLHIQRTVKFQEKYVTEYGHGAENCCDVIAQELRIS